MTPELYSLIAVLIGVGALAGVSAGLFGIGGGAVIVPGLYYAFEALGYGEDVIIHCAVATSSAIIIVNALRSVRGHHAQGAVDWDILWPRNPLRSYAVWIGVGAFIGALWIAPQLSGRALTLLFASVAAVIALQFILGRTQLILRRSVPGGMAPMAMGTGVGGLSALMGIGGGSLTVPLMSLCNVPIHRAIGTASGIGFAIAVPATLGYVISGWSVSGRPPGSLGYVNGIGFALVATTAFFTIPLGVRLAHKLDQRRLKMMFGIALLIIAANMARKILL